MTEVERMLNQMDRSFRADAWHGPAVLEALDGVTAARAMERPIAGAHSIWELVLHMAYWKGIVRRRLAGEQPVPDEAMNFPKVKDASPAAWKRTIADLEAAHEALRAEVARVDDSQLDEPAFSGTVARYVAIHGMVQHDLYHAGQIAILKKGKSVKKAKPAARKVKAKPMKKAKRPARRAKPKASNRRR